jgi:hypothetical protein
MAPSYGHEWEVATVVFIVLEIAADFYTVTVALYNDVSPVGGTTKVLVTARKIQRDRSWKTYGHTSRHCCGKWDSGLRSTVVMKPYCRMETLFSLNVVGKHAGRGSAPAPMA